MVVNISEAYKFCDQCGECNPFYDECHRRNNFEKYFNEIYKKVI